MEKRKAMFLYAAMMAMCASAEPTVTYVTAKQRCPCDGFVDIDCTESGIEEAANSYKLVVVVVDKDTEREFPATHFSIANGGTVASGCEFSVDDDCKLLWNVWSFGRRYRLKYAEIYYGEQRKIGLVALTRRRYL